MSNLDGMLKTSNHPVHLGPILGKQLLAELPPKTATLDVDIIGSQLHVLSFFECYENVHAFRLCGSDALYRWSGSGDNNVGVTKHLQGFFCNKS